MTDKQKLAVALQALRDIRHALVLAPERRALGAIDHITTRTLDRLDNPKEAR